MIKKISYLVLYSILLPAMLTGFIPGAIPAATNTATKTPPAPTATLVPTPTQIPGVGPGGKIPVGIVLPSTAWSVYSQSRTSFINYLTKLGYSAPILLSNDSAAVEKSNVKSLIKQGIKVLILCSVEPWNSAEIVNEAHTAGVKVIAYDRLIRDTTSVDYYVSFYGVSIGQAQAQYLVDHANGKGIPLFLYAGSSNDSNSFMFFKGAWEVLQPKINDGTFVVKNSSFANTFKDKSILTENEEGSLVSGIAIANWNQDEARSLARANLKAVNVEDKGDVAILAPNDGTARGIADIFANDKDVTSYIITGQDADNLSLQYIRSGHQTMTVFKDTRILAKDALDAALAFLTDQTPISRTTIHNGATNIPFSPSGGIVVDKSNVDTFKK
jgi:putative multiple sugar transport system substrate-binding protein